MGRTKWYNLNSCALFLGILLLTILYTNIRTLSADQKPLVFSTYEGFEIDKCASIWLIKRFIDKNAIIRFYPANEVIHEGIVFDTPEAKFRRYYNKSTFETFLQYYELNDARLEYIGKIIHDIEVNTWERKALAETLMIQEKVNRIILNSKESSETIEKCNKFFDSLYEGE